MFEGNFEDANPDSSPLGLLAAETRTAPGRDRDGDVGKAPALRGSPGRMALTADSSHPGPSCTSSEASQPNTLNSENTWDLRLQHCVENRQCSAVTRGQDLGVAQLLHVVPSCQKSSVGPSPGLCQEGGSVAHNMPKWFD